MTDEIEERTRRLSGALNAQVWAHEFVQAFPTGAPPDEGLMIGWFANAIMAGWDARGRWMTAGSTNNVETIGQRIRRERLDRQWAQRTLADIAGVGVPHISKIETDREKPSPELLTRMAEAFEIDPEELSLVARQPSGRFLEMLATNPSQLVVVFHEWETRSLISPSPSVEQQERRSASRAGTGSIPGDGVTVSDEGVVE